ncbi:MAG: hypothetical protein REI64_11970 [Pedobacter sp.]|uniref:hypothetical protein n=1 Tax=Bacteroidota TaxID=976 RepID=UPI002806E850|nr:hypothetical protein [Pedobacter sp.]MDQ8005509.1 hypothetical protein [Pedobacter sp.]
MSNINYIYILPLIATLIASLYIFITANKDKKAKNITMTLVVATLLSSLIISFYYDSIFNDQYEEVSELLAKRNSLNIDTSNLNKVDLHSLELARNRMKDLLDSIKLQNIELEKLKVNIENYEKIIGNKREVKGDITKKILENKADIAEIKGYNTKLDDEILDKRKGYMVSGRSSNFVFDCPKDYLSENLELKLNFINETLFEKIEYISISFLEKTDEKNYTIISNEIFKPQKGVNAFKIKNEFKNKNNRKIELEVGYVLKSEMGKDFPRIERVVCRNY